MAVLKVGTGHTRQEVDVHLQIVVAGAGDGQLEEVQADAPAATPPTWDGERKRQAGRRHVICLDGAHLLFESSRPAGPPHQAARQGTRLATVKVPAQQSSMRLMQHLRLMRAWHAKAVAARAETVE